MESLVREPFPEEFCPQNNNANLLQLWDTYANAKYEEIYTARLPKTHLQELGKYFLLSNGGICLDAGCGTGNAFSLIVQRIQPRLVYAVDWSEKMIARAKREAQRVQQDNTQFKIRRADLSKLWVCPDSYFDYIVSNQLITFLPCGWKMPLREMARVLKTEGCLYLGTFLKEWEFTRIIWKHALVEFIVHPIVSFREAKLLKQRKIVAQIDKKVRERDAEYPSLEELLDFLQMLGFKEIETTKTYWGGGVALRAKLKK